jgi:predicted acyl esterase
VAHRFSAGNRIRLLIAGGSFPRWERNLGTRDDAARSTRMVPSRRTIDPSASRVLLSIARLTAGKPIVSESGTRRSAVIDCSDGCKQA